MLPPIHPSTLERNPGFDVLYKDLCTRKLNPDGSTRDTKKQRIHDEIRRNLDTVRVELAKSQILIRTLADLPSKAGDLPPELHEVTEIITAQLSGHVPDLDREVLEGDVEFFLENVEPISTAISQQLTIVADHLGKIANPKAPPSIPSLPSTSQTLLSSATVDLPAELATERVELANLAYKVLTTHRQVLETVIRILEQSKHGSISRATKTRAELLNSKAVALGLRARIHSLTHPPPPEFLQALRNFRSSQESTEQVLLDRESLAKKALEHYEKAGSKAMLDIARRAEYLRKEIARTEAEIGKLERGE
ncbi:hypothetical protein K469DRAFT_165170 [Zopfia rhizophila CBS 207.26]|uniref:Uncharacterized protein n=1 Tax=Zopfia rhizophila CBS 207.26 TaxID=1314779 RepID=A0A6A6E3D4_9PEZI|nr:hypothetical protein K469DRAFT_165170 [Zopfia rhizophila CBS 207.26]